VSVPLSAAWCESVSPVLAALPPGPGGSGVVELVVSGGDPARQSTVWVVDDGRIVSVAAGGDGAEPEVTIPVSRADVESIIGGELDPAVAFMRGDLKPEGSARALLAFLSAVTRDDCRAALAG
jgi:putative sterol carrier protein